ncbi:MAG: hypothetical protein H0W88_01075 [Parachlamydiaceae bacterium]|nr:hypothetical protein [Parachlamydiaceae bacterium]
MKKFILPLSILLCTILFFANAEVIETPTKNEPITASSVPVTRIDTATPPKQEGTNPTVDIKKLEEEIVIFTPPPSWNVADSSSLPPSVKIMVVGKGDKTFPPSLNLSTEPYKGSLKQYLRIVKSMNDSQGYVWKDLGSITTEAGPANLSQVDTKNQWGDVRLMHVILIKNGKVYILTASALKDEFPKFYQEFFKSMRSLRVNKNIFETVSDPKKKAILQTAYQDLLTKWNTALVQKKQEQPTLTIDKIKSETFKSEQFQKSGWTPFVETINQKFGEMSSDWKTFVIQKVQNDLFEINI